MILRLLQSGAAYLQFWEIGPIPTNMGLATHIVKRGGQRSRLWASGATLRRNLRLPHGACSWPVAGTWRAGFLRSVQRAGSGTRRLPCRQPGSARPTVLASPKLGHIPEVDAPGRRPAPGRGFPEAGRRGLSRLAASRRLATRAPEAGAPLSQKVLGRFRYGRHADRLALVAARPAPSV